MNDVHDWRIGNDGAPPRWFVFRRTPAGEKIYAVTSSGRLRTFRTLQAAQRAAKKFKKVTA